MCRKKSEARVATAVSLLLLAVQLAALSCMLTRFPNSSDATSSSAIAGRRQILRQRHRQHDRGQRRRDDLDGSQRQREGRFLSQPLDMLSERLASTSNLLFRLIGESNARSDADGGFGGWSGGGGGTATGAGATNQKRRRRVSPTKEDLAMPPPPKIEAKRGTMRLDEANSRRRQKLEKPAAAAKEEEPAADESQKLENEEEIGPVISQVGGTSEDENDHFSELDRTEAAALVEKEIKEVPVSQLRMEHRRGGGVVVDDGFGLVMTEAEASSMSEEEAAAIEQEVSQAIRWTPGKKKVKVAANGAKRRKPGDLYSEVNLPVVTPEYDPAPSRRPSTRPASPKRRFRPYVRKYGYKPVGDKYKSGEENKKEVEEDAKTKSAPFSRSPSFSSGGSSGRRPSVVVRQRMRTRTTTTTPATTTTTTTSTPPPTPAPTHFIPQEEEPSFQPQLESIPLTENQQHVLDLAPKDLASMSLGELQEVMKIRAGLVKTRKKDRQQAQQELEAGQVARPEVVEYSSDDEEADEGDEESNEQTFDFQYNIDLSDDDDGTYSAPDEADTYPTDFPNFPVASEEGDGSDDDLAFETTTTRYYTTRRVTTTPYTSTPTPTTTTTNTTTTTTPYPTTTFEYVKSSSSTVRPPPFWSRNPKKQRVGGGYGTKSTSSSSSTDGGDLSLIPHISDDFSLLSDMMDLTTFGLKKGASSSHVTSSNKYSTPFFPLPALPQQEDADDVVDEHYNYNYGEEEEDEQVDYEQVENIISAHPPSPPTEVAPVESSSPIYYEDVTNLVREDPEPSRPPASQEEEEDDEPVILPQAHNTETYPSYFEDIKDVFEYAISDSNDEKDDEEEELKHESSGPVPTVSIGSKESGNFVSFSIGSSKESGFQSSETGVLKLGQPTRTYDNPHYNYYHPNHRYPGGNDDDSTQATTAAPTGADAAPASYEPFTVRFRKTTTTQKRQDYTTPTPFTARPSTTTTTIRTVYLGDRATERPRPKDPEPPKYKAPAPNTQTPFTVRHTSKPAPPAPPRKTFKNNRPKYEQKAPPPPPPPPPPPKKKTPFTVRPTQTPFTVKVTPTRLPFLYKGATPFTVRPPPPRRRFRPYQGGKRPPPPPPGLRPKGPPPLPKKQIYSPPPPPPPPPKRITKPRPPPPTLKPYSKPFTSRPPAASTKEDFTVPARVTIVPHNFVKHANIKPNKFAKKKKEEDWGDESAPPPLSSMFNPGVFSNHDVELKEPFGNLPTFFESNIGSVEEHHPTRPSFLNHKYPTTKPTRRPTYPKDGGEDYEDFLDSLYDDLGGDDFKQEVATLFDDIGEDGESYGGFGNSFDLTDDEDDEEKREDKDIPIHEGKNAQLNQPPKLLKSGYLKNPYGSDFIRLEVDEDRLQHNKTAGIVHVPLVVVDRNKNNLRRPPPPPFRLRRKGGGKRKRLPPPPPHGPIAPRRRRKKKPFGPQLRPNRKKNFNLGQSKKVQQQQQQQQQSPKPKSDVTSASASSDPEKAQKKADSVVKSVKKLPPKVQGPIIAVRQGPAASPPSSSRTPKNHPKPLLQPGPPPHLVPGHFPSSVRGVMEGLEGLVSKFMSGLDNTKGVFGGREMRDSQWELAATDTAGEEELEKRRR